jgi:Fe-S-cluster-containing dehydrogenase component/DMSO reductase anchor subunit
MIKLGPRSDRRDAREWNGVTLVDQLIAEQQQLTAVERFSQKHERTDFPAQSKYYRDLVPLSKPGARQQYAFEVDLDRCTSCKACVSACHSLNGLEENETWRDVGFIIGEENGKVYQQTVTTACHHCVEPGCLQGCPVKAYEKDPVTGIVVHLDDQCIGCQYCTMKCPYDVPKYSERLGIVRKCDMCHGRLAAGEAPACVQACPAEAIRITLVDVDVVVKEAIPGSNMLPGAHDSSYTVPTTRYLSEKLIPSNSTPAGAYVLKLEEPHWPLAVMLVLTQASTGMFLAAALLGPVFPATFETVHLPLLTAALSLLVGGLLTSTLHLGRPLGAWRFFLGLRTSWMSREILVFTIFGGTAGAAVAASWLTEGTPLSRAATDAAALVGAVAVFTSVMIYVDTRREFWRLKHTLPRFFGTILLMGLVATGTFVSWAGALGSAEASELARGLAASAAVLLSVFYWCERSVWRNAAVNEKSPLHRSARIVAELLASTTRARAAAYVFSAVCLVAAGVTGSRAGGVLMGLALMSTAVCALLERYVFFTAVVPFRMPGGV